jgi:formate hydrogenlyase transcriptional activator
MSLNIGSFSPSLSDGSYPAAFGLGEWKVNQEVSPAADICSKSGFAGIVGQSAALRQVLHLVDMVAPSDSTVLLLGETGTGKELVARAIHDHSRRRRECFVTLNCAAVPSPLFESELFGHERGAFTGAHAQKAGRLEVADHGTLFLDEIGDLPLELQPKLLRALQERAYERVGSARTRSADLRLVAATNRDLERMIAEREFRSDLYYRLNVFPIRIPPLRERREDIPLLVHHFIKKYERQMGKRIDMVPEPTMQKLMSWHWPGNIRELQNVIERAVILTRGSSLEVPFTELRKVHADEPTPTTAAQGREEIARIVKETIDALDGKRGVAEEHARKQREEIEHALSESKGRVGGEGGAAARLELNRTTLLSRMKKLGVNPKQFA